MAAGVYSRRAARGGNIVRHGENLRGHDDAAGGAVTAKALTYPSLPSRMGRRVRAKRRKGRPGPRAAPRAFSVLDSTPSLRRRGRRRTDHRVVRRVAVGDGGGV